MTHADDKFVKRILTPLQPTPPLDPQILEQEKAKFLLQGENYRLDVAVQSSRGNARQTIKDPVVSHIRRPFPLIKVLVGVLLALVILVGSSASVYASQSSLPGDSLYPLKSISEEIRLSLIRSPEARLKITLDYTDRRVNEITTLLSRGQIISDQTSQRFQGELDRALLLAAELSDEQMQNALGQVRRSAEKQGLTLDELLNKLPEQAEPAILMLQQRIQEQVRLSSIGESDPQAYRFEIRERHQRQHKPGRNSTSDQSDGSAPLPTTTTLPTKEGNKSGNGGGRPSEVPGQDDTSPGQGNSNPGNGNQNPDKSPMP